jgi:hypothetical protein
MVGEPYRQRDDREGRIGEARRRKDRRARDVQIIRPVNATVGVNQGTGYVAVVLSNYGGASQPVVDKIRTLVRSRTTPVAP